MPLTVEDIDFLASSAGEKLLKRLAGEDLSEDRTLALLSLLRKEFTAVQSGAALLMARLRQKAVEKFGDSAAKLFFTPAGLEQASDPLARLYHARQSGKTILDICCGIGADSLAFAAAGKSVLGLDIDPVCVHIARYNAAVLRLLAQFEICDVRGALPPEYELAFFDPARRDEKGRRIHHVEQMIPPLSLIKNWQYRQILVKLSPAVELAQIAVYRGRVEFLSVMGGLKEALLLYPAAESNENAAVLLTETETLRWMRGEIPETILCEPLAWLVESDPALIRAGLVQDAAAAFGGALLDETIAYFTSASRPESPWVRAWEIIDWMPFHLKKLRAYLRERHIGRVTIKKRGSPLTPEGLMPQLKLKGDASCTLVLTRLKGAPIVIICRDIMR